MEEYLSNEEVNGLITKAKSGDNAAWESLYYNFEKYVHSRAWHCLKKLEVSENQKKDIEEELYQAGWQGFLSALRVYNPRKGGFLAYATHYIDGEMSKELKFTLNSPGYTGEIDLQMLKGFFDPRSGISVEEPTDVGEKFSAERRVLQIMELLRLLTDEEHSLSKDELGNLLRFYRIVKYQNKTPLEARNTFTSTIENMLLEVNPLIHTDENDKDYRIKYEGYKENRLDAKRNGKKGKKAEDINCFSYVHIFDHAELDSLIQLVCFSDILSVEEKEKIVDKLVSTASLYYHTPFQSERGARERGKLKFNPRAIHGRFSGRVLQDNQKFSENINLIQQAVNNLCQIRFKFNSYTAEHEMVPKTEYTHVLSPYHLVVYHDNYYCIGLKKGDTRIWHYRVDLMSEVEMLTDEEGKNVPIDVCDFDGLPICNAYWDPEKYMAEHLYMAFDEPREILIKIRNTDYTILHDWFGNHYEKTEQSCEAGYDIVAVRTSPSMIVHWAMQYAGAVEVMDEEIREKIRNEIDNLKNKYS